MAGFIAHMNQPGSLGLIVMACLLFVIFLLIIYAAMTASARADAQSERSWAAWCQSHAEQHESTEGSGV